MKDFALIGAAGYVAPRHMAAIRQTGNRLVAALDRHDSVGVIDSYFPDADFFTEFERFDRHIDKLRRRGSRVEYVSICSPNYLHDAHIRFALRSRAHAICEKPVVLNPRNINGLAEIERESGLRVFTILQLRLHPAIAALREAIGRDHGRVHDVDITYIAARGHWYRTSWKGDPERSGGIATNIGIHLFDMLAWVFGDVAENVVHLSRPECASGFLRLAKARVRWFLSIDAAHLPEACRRQGQRAFRAIAVDGHAVEFSDGFGDLHTESYRDILAGRGWGLADTRAAIETVHAIRTAVPATDRGEWHPLAAVAASS